LQEFSIAFFDSEKAGGDREAFFTRVQLNSEKRGATGLSMGLVQQKVKEKFDNGPEPESTVILSPNL
jgi:hypothetical protein